MAFEPLPEAVWKLVALCTVIYAIKLSIRGKRR